MVDEKVEKIFWADQIAIELKNRVETNPILAKIYEKQGILIYDEKTPSGKIHIGSGRGWVIHDVIAKSCRKIGLNAKFVLASDDMDPYDKPNKDLPESFNKYLGVPFRYIPSPVEGYKSFAEYYFLESTTKFKEIGIECEFESTGENYEKGIFNEAIKIALDNSFKIKQIFEEMYEKPYPRLPFNMICDNCGKIATTAAIKWDSEKELVFYKCEENLVAWAKGCNHEAWKSPYNGGGKFPWKVEWPAKWFSKGVICEFAGKDHFSSKGSRDIGVLISEKVFNYPTPYPSTGIETGDGYEFFTVGGKKMSTSKGRGFSFSETVDLLPPQMLRYLLVKTRPSAVIDFDPETKNDLILLFERFDKTERVYFGKEEDADEREKINSKRIYELSHLGEIPKEMPVQLPLTYSATIIQCARDEDDAISQMKKTGHIRKDATKADIESAKHRLIDSKKWAENFAPEQFRFKINETVPHDLNINEKQKSVLKKIALALKEKEYSETEIPEKLFEISKSEGIAPKEMFEAAYKVLISKTQGPKLGGFILTIGQNKVAEMFEKV